MNKERACSFLDENEINAWSQIEKAKTVIITSHIHPDGDAVGSSLAMLRYCRAKGKKVNVIIDDDIPPNYGFLEDFAEIHKPGDVQRMNADLLIIVDTDQRRIREAGKGKYGCVLNIDHHDTNPGNSDYCIIRGEYFSASELLYHIFSDTGYNIDTETAACLYTGLITDTMFFRAPGIKPDTFEVAGKLAGTGIDLEEITINLETKSFEETLMVSKAISSVKRFFDGTVAGVLLDEEYDALELTDFIIDSIRYIKGIKIAYLLKHEKNGGYRVRMRSQCIDVSIFAKENGGGGHTDAAGFTIEENDGDKAERLLIGRLEKWLEQYFG